MHFKLTGPFREATHAEITFTYFPGAAIHVRGGFGSEDSQGRFQYDSALTPFERHIVGQELDAFLEDSIAKGLPAKHRGSFRMDDLVKWLNKHGVAKSTWTAE